MIKLNDLAIGYNGEAILEHIDQEFDDGLIYGILAKSGAGKTTLLKTISGLLHPVHGEVVIDGTTYRNADKNPVYMMHQRYSNFGWLSCTENVLIAQRDKKLRSRDDAIKVLAAVGLEQYADISDILFSPCQFVVGDYYGSVQMEAVDAALAGHPALDLNTDVVYFSTGSLTYGSYYKTIGDHVFRTYI